MFRKICVILMTTFVLIALSGNAQQPQKQLNAIPANFRISDEEMRLYQMINEYREKYHLPPVPLSVSLCYVASAQVKDLFFNHPDQEPCNLYSWSDKGPWKAFCYPKDENKKNSVWDKPKEITPYKGKGYEIVYWENNPVDIDSVINFWKSVDYFNSFLMNTGKWQGNKWEAIGIGVYENYACAWFGQIPDPNGQSQPVIIKADTSAKPSAIKSATPAKPPILNSATAAMPSALNSEGKPFTYYIIVKSNVPLKDTVKLMKFFIDKGLPNVRFFSNDGKGRISVFETSKRDDAIAKLKEIKALYKDAWLLKN